MENVKIEIPLYEVKRRFVADTSLFRPAAIHFEKFGYYCAAPKGTTAYMEYWDTEQERCLSGYTAPNGEYITGYFYFYLNYCQIVKNIVDPKTGRLGRERGFPEYYDYDREFFDYFDACERYSRHAVVLKCRQRGYSFKAASMLDRNYYLIRESKSYAIASDKTYLLKDGLLSKAWEFMSFVDEHTAWYKKRQKVDTKMHKRASLVVTKDGVKTEVGYKSEIIGMTLNNDVDKIRGIRGKLILYEEGGKFPGLTDAWMIARSSVEDPEGGTFGTQMVFGTGGSDESDYFGLQSIFYQPEVFHCLPVKNIWDDGATEPCGFFVPQYYNLGPKFMDEMGNSLLDESLKHTLAEREAIISKATSRLVVDRFIAERPFTPAEACLQLTGNIFPKAELSKHLATIRTNRKLSEFKQVGDLVWQEDGTLAWVPAHVPQDLRTYRIPQGQRPDGQIVIWEHPIDSPPYGLYISGCDTYDFDKSSTDSLGSVFIYKRFQSFEQYHDIIVAEYTGRPERSEIFYETVRKLLIYYNATCLYENEKTGLFQYFTKVHSEHLLADQPDIIKDIIKDSTVQRGKGIHMPKQIKSWAEGKLKEWLIEERGNGSLGLHTILSEPLLEELISYNDEHNFDRVIALMLVMVYREQLHRVVIKAKHKEEIFQNRLFPSGVFIENSYYNVI